MDKISKRYYNPKDKIESFIFNMKQYFSDELEFVFYRGYCYWFAFILAERFHGEIYFNPDIVHFACKINNNLYDIYGKIRIGFDPITGEETSDKWISWNDFQINHHEAVDSIVKSCIKKD